MSECLPRVAAAQAVGVLKRAGWQELRQRGSHVHLGHPDRPGRMTVAPHGGIIHPKTLKSIPTQAGLTVEGVAELM